jgi:hypothetical protein
MVAKKRADSKNRLSKRLSTMTNVIGMQSGALNTIALFFCYMSNSHLGLLGHEQVQLIHAPAIPLNTGNTAKHPVVSGPHAPMTATSANCGGISCKKLLVVNGVSVDTFQRLEELHYSLV